MKLLQLSVGCVFLISLTSWSTTPVSPAPTINQKDLQDNSMFVAKRIAVSDFCYNKGYYDSEFSAKEQIAMEKLVEYRPSLFNKGLIEAYTVQQKANLNQAPGTSDQIKNFCSALKLELTKDIMSIESKQREIEIEKNRPVIINNTSTNTPPTPIYTPKYTNCMNLGFGMTSCSTF